MNKSSKIVGANLEQLRKMLNLTQTEFAEMFGISQGLVSKIEEGKLEPSMEMLNLLNTHNVDINILFNDFLVAKIDLLDQEVEALKNINGPALRLLKSVGVVLLGTLGCDKENEPIPTSRISSAKLSIERFFEHIKNPVPKQVEETVCQ